MHTPYPPSFDIEMNLIAILSMLMLLACGRVDKIDVLLKVRNHRYPIEMDCNAPTLDWYGYEAEILSN